MFVCRSAEDNSTLLHALETMVDDAADVIGMFANGSPDNCYSDEFLYFKHAPTIKLTVSDIL